MRRRAKTVLPTTQWFSNRWAVQWRRGNRFRDLYEVTHAGQLVAAVVVTRAGWKWSAPNPRSRAMLPAWVWSDETFESWQDAVTAFARSFRRRGIGRGADLPGPWHSYIQKGRTSPWTPRPVHDDFTAYDRAHQ